MTERRVGMYTCSKCGTKFPTVISRQRYLIVAEEQLNSIQEEIVSLKKGNDQLQTQQRELESILDKTAKENEVRKLEIKLAELEAFVSFLRKEKGELEQKVSKLR